MGNCQRFDSIQFLWFGLISKFGKPTTWSQSHESRQMRRMTHDFDLKFSKCSTTCVWTELQESKLWNFFLKTWVSFWEENRIETQWKKRIASKVNLGSELETKNGVDKKEPKFKWHFHEIEDANHMWLVEHDLMTTCDPFGCLQFYEMKATTKQPKRMKWAKHWKTQMMIWIEVALLSNKS